MPPFITFYRRDYIVMVVTLLCFYFFFLIVKQKANLDLVKRNFIWKDYWKGEKRREVLQ